MRSARRVLCGALLATIASIFAAAPLWAQEATQSPPPSKPEASSILDYIHKSWDTLSRSMTDCHSFTDPKLLHATAILYLPAEVPTPPEVAALKNQCSVDVEHLPRQILSFGELKLTDIPKPGLLYLPNKYVVPGGRFNEMYGWDSYFIILGLLREGRLRAGPRHGGELLL